MALFTLEQLDTHTNVDLKVDLCARQLIDGINFITGAEFGIRVVGGRMCTGGFIGVYVAKVMRGLSAVQCIKEG